MGQSESKENKNLSKVTHFSPKEINTLRQNVKEQDRNNITEDVFKDSVKQCVPSVSTHDDIFLKRLYAAFGGDQEKAIDFREFVDGLSVFMKGNPDEKLLLSFRLYDVDKDGFISKNELEDVISQLSQMLLEEERQGDQIQAAIDSMFRDLDVDGDGKLSIEEFKLSAMKEPLIADFIEHFLDQHDLSDKPQVISRPTSVSSRKSSQTPIKQRRPSLRLSQAELLGYSLQQQVNNLSTETTPNPSPRNSFCVSVSTDGSPGASSSGLGLTTAPLPATLSVDSAGRPTLAHRTSRSPNMVSLDAAMVSM